ncbi:putative zinc finger protein [Bibersteinia trehalosi]|uniref:zf-HC2 domain-containing protein n=1 Tax=Bibersteinia trehalosi TaxID=47735 RepID=UPI0010535538|nr:zf-HC2 domain-containing protein [Bibersteinia trehalosi]TCT15173.1 putative zinc finger protein [Bibersteinia trehalosi]
MLNCKEATQLLSLRCEQKLRFKQQLQLKVHLMVCGRCRGFAKNNQLLDQMMKEFAEHNSKE